MKARTFLVLLAVPAAAAWLGYSLLTPYAGFTNEVFVEFPKGTSSPSLARMLQDAGVIRWEWQFLVVRAVRRRSSLQAGEYRFWRPHSVWGVFDRIARGDIFYYELAVPEGHNMFDIAQAVSSLGLMKPQEFLQAVRDPALIRDLAPQAPSLEGYLFPSTYRLSRHSTAEQICRLMTDHFRRAWKDLRPGALDVHRAVTLASLVEKETAVPAERATIASVFENRQRIGMALQCDPTAIYAALLENRYRGALYRSDLDTDNAYNTYRHAGLPPGPIANPGLDSLKAALHPAETDYLYFVAKPGASGAPPC